MVDAKMLLPMEKKKLLIFDGDSTKRIEENTVRLLSGVG
jgi:hypothetical protein